MVPVISIKSVPHTNKKDSITTCKYQLQRRYVQLPADEVDTQLLQDATRKEAAQNKQ
jgi:hypothetical protein